MNKMENEKDSFWSKQTPMKFGTGLWGQLSGDFKFIGFDKDGELIAMSEQEFLAQMRDHSPEMMEIKMKGYMKAAEREAKMMEEAFLQLRQEENVKQAKDIIDGKQL
jgi:hypothetical protein